MAIRDLLWTCPCCGVVGGIRAHGRLEECASCGTRYRRSDRATISAARDGEPERTLSASDWTAQLPAIHDRFPEASDETWGPVPVVVRQVREWTRVQARGETLGWAERFGARREAILSVTPAHLILSDTRGESRTPLERLSAIQASSSTLQIARRHQPVLSIRFPTSSVLLWEALLQSRTRSRYREIGLGEVDEFQPVIRARSLRPAKGCDPPPAGSHNADVWAASARATALYRTCQWLVRTAWRLLGKIDIQGLRHLPARGPFLLVCNHQSDLDPLLIPSIIRRPVHAVAKSTLFNAPGLGWVLPRICAFPVRRYQTDPQAVRVALRRLRQGAGVAIFIEGERSWDGRLQDPRPGTVRLALKAGVPIVPCAISGSYEASPRWHSGIRSGSVRIRFLQPIHFQALDSRAERERVLIAAGDILMRALAAGLQESGSSQ